MRRYLKWTGLDVRFVSNVTDIEDKIIARAAEENCSTDEVAARYEALWFETMDALGVQRPDADPHATAYVDDMVELIATFWPAATLIRAVTGLLLHRVRTWLWPPGSPGPGVLGRGPGGGGRGGTQAFAVGLRPVEVGQSE